MAVLTYNDIWKIIKKTPVAKAHPKIVTTKIWIDHVVKKNLENLPNTPTNKIRLSSILLKHLKMKTGKGPIAVSAKKSKDKKVKKLTDKSRQNLRKKQEAEDKKVPKDKVIVPDKEVKGVIKQVEKNLTAYGKATIANEPDTYSKKAIAKDWTIVTDNCYGSAYMKALSLVHKEAGRAFKYASPFFSMYIHAPDYITLLENFDEYMKLTPVAQKPVNKDDKFGGYSPWRRDISKYPVIVLEGSQGKVYIHYAHEKESAKEAIRKWESRKARMNMDKKDMFVKMDSRDRFTVALGKRFLALKQFPHKRLFLNDIKKYKKNFEGLKNVVFTDTSKDGAVIENNNPVPAKG
jgi:uncharacterized protein (DUF1919 family)